MAQAPSPNAAPLLRIENLATHLDLARGTVRAVDGVSLELARGQILGLVGESGSGKTMTGLSILRLLPRPFGRIAAGSIRLDGVDLARLSERDMARHWRGKRVAMVSQDPLTALNPVFSVGDQVGAPLRRHGPRLGRGALRGRIAALLGRVRIPSPETRLDDYPHQFSGGMRQRVAAAMAIAGGPDLIVADEPTSALDVTIQVQMMALFRSLRDESGTSLILITHDFGVAAGICDRIAVMYAGRIVEASDVRDVFRRPAHPYTRALLGAMPSLGGRKSRRLPAIPGQPPSLLDPPEGCRFAARCPHRMPACAAYPPDFPVGAGHRAACWLAEAGA
jgi:peptide/nickel transport system ATP-binding protein